jgi:GNAT superfamily N-acetyltransferase
MIEIRTIREDEAEAFLNLLCGVFDLDYARAHSIFFSEPMFDLACKWALFSSGEPLSILTTVPLHFGWGSAIGIAGVATRSECRGKGYASQLLQEVIDRSANGGERAAFLFAKDPSLYKRIGFEIVDRVVRGQIVTSLEEPDGEPLSFEAVRAIYDQWAEGDPGRLRRDDKRWSYWKWNLRLCTRVGDGYICEEGATVRECLVTTPMATWPVGVGAEWYGLESMTQRLPVPIEQRMYDFHLMGYRVPEPPQMFMTDQF